METYIIICKIDSQWRTNKRKTMLKKKKKKMSNIMSSHKDQDFFFFLAALRLRYCMLVFSSCGEWGLLFVIVQRIFIAVASLVAEHKL